jgi:ubiquinone/menaquinone biosynthesis C-methylase UbiE
MDWDKDYLKSWNHPHRYMITAILSSFPWVSLVEVGCGPGPNLVNIVKNLQGKQVGGVDIVPEAIELANKTFTGGMFKVSPADDVMMSDKATDVVLTDMMLIYVDPSRIDKHIKELKRICRNHIVLCEFHSDSWWQRLKLRFTSGYNAYDYIKLLKKHGFYNIQKFKIPPEVWPKEDGTPANPKENQFRWIIKAQVPKRG